MSAFNRELMPFGLGFILLSESSSDFDHSTIALPFDAIIESTLTPTATTILEQHVVPATE